MSLDFALLQLHHHADAFPVALVPQVGDAVDLLLVHQLGDLLQQGGLVHLVGQLGEDELLPVPGPLDLLHVGLGPHHAAAAAGAVGVQHPLGAQHEPAAGEVRPLDVGHDAVQPQGGVVDEGHQGGAALPQVVGRDAGGHAHRDALAAVHQQVGEAGGEHQGLLHAVVVVGAPVHRVLFQVGHHLAGQPGQPGLGVAHGRRAVAVDGAEVALAVHQHVAHGEGLGHAHQGVVDGGVAVGMVLAHDVAHGAGGLLVGAVPLVAAFLHGVQHPPVHRLEAVVHAGQGPSDDDAHGVVQVGLPHFLFDFDGLDALVGDHSGFRRFHVEQGL